MSALVPLEVFVQCLKKVPDPRSKHGQSHPFRTVLAIVFLGLLANLSTLAKIERWTVLTNMALSLTRLLRNGERTLREIWERCLDDPTDTAERLGFKT